MKNKNVILVVVLIIILIVICLGLFFGFGYNKSFRTTYDKLKNTAWGKLSTEFYLNDELAHIKKKFNDKPYIYVTKDQYVYCYITVFGKYSDDREYTCDFYNYEIKDDYMTVYGLFYEKEIKLFYEFKNNDNQLVITYFDDGYKMVETYNRAAG